jgi:V-type H+-transporting ATPase subunit a
MSHYPFGVDPSWYHTTNELAFFNSLKMKLAVTLGVAQMVFGIVLSLLNHLHFQDRLAVWFEFVPRMLFMLCTFGYMIFLILLKFCIDWTRSSVPPPNLVQTMIAMFLAPGSVDADKQLYAGQAFVQSVLLLVALGSVPVMLLAQPLLARAEHKRLFPVGHAHLSPRVDSDSTPSPFLIIDADGRTASSPSSATHQKRRKHGGAHYDAVAGADVDVTQDWVDHEEGKAGEHRVTLQALADPKSAVSAPAVAAVAEGHGADPRSPHYNFADHAITQGIHTIEFVLGAVSNTASYLRLWALSLAHAQLSAVFWVRRSRFRCVLAV